MDETTEPPRTRVCAVDDCDRPVKARGLCNMHHLRMRRTGSLELSRKPTELERLRVAFWSRVAGADDGADSPNLPRDIGICWEWAGRRHVHRGGHEDYGVVSVWDVARQMTVTRMAHVVAWRVQMGRWPQDGAHVHHVCRNPLCVRAEHLAELDAAEHDWVHRMGLP